MKTNYRLEGPSGAPVVTLTHPLGATLALWDDHVAALTKRFRVLRYDVRGHGGSENPPGPYTLEQMAGDLFDLLDFLGIEETHFVGVSMGGLIGMTAALTRPSRIQSLVLCDTTACYGPAVRPMWDDRIRVAESDGMTAALVDRTMAIWFTEAFRARHPDVVERIATMLRKSDPRGYAAAIRAIGFVDLTDRIGAIRCPALVVVGEQDPGTPPAMARVILERIAGSELLILQGAMHCAVVEDSERFLHALLEFLAARP
ncbi:MAG: alpha/beta fold hydrolase [Candidatus Rokubacteria bacterium]|nr:alpha/beta fold hydrolase [Candidatus Rokubacteria bacterium]